MEEKSPQLNKEQAQAVQHEKGPLLIVAGAGTGKTTVITERISWLIQQKNLSPDQILALTFTEKAAGEMEDRVDAALPYGYVDLWVSTFHAFCERLLKEHALDIGLPHQFSLLNQTESWLLIKKNLDRFDLDYYRPLGNPTKFIHALLSHFSRCKDEEVYPEDYLAHAEGLISDLDGMESSSGKASHSDESAAVEASRIREVASAYHTYQQLLLEHDALDFGDLILYTLKLFRTRPHILKAYQEQFAYILVDEFQDTNFAQYELIKLLAGEKKNITVVGDDDQSIYKFRGASVSNILNFKKDYPESVEIFLQTNYRSPQNILDASYEFIKLNNPDRLEVKLQELSSDALSKKLLAHTDRKGNIVTHFAHDLDGEVEYVLDTIVSLYEKSPEPLWSDYVILVRANDAADQFVQGLEERGIPHQFLAAKGLYSKPVVRDIVNYLRLLDDYRESPALYRILHLPVLDIKQYQVANLLYWAGRKQWSLFEVLRNIASIPKVEEQTVFEVQKLVSWIDRHTSLVQTQSVWKVILAFLQDTGYIKYLENMAPQKTKEQFGLLNQFANRVKQFEQSQENPSVSDFLIEFEMELAAGDTGSLQWDIETGPDMVRIMTIHGAKGLEFPHVFIPNLVDKRFPTISRKDPIILPDELVKDILPVGDSHIQEERRLMYVAMTRAKESLYLTGAYDYGGSRPKKPSKFLQELSLAPEEEEKQIKDVKKPEIKPVPTKTQATKDAQVGKKKFSFTQLEAYRNCPLQYKYAHVLRIPVRGKHTFSFGKTMHATLQQFFTLVREQAGSRQGDLFATAAENTPGIKANEKDLIRLYEENWLDDWYESKKQHDEYKQKGKDSLKAFYKDWSEKRIVPEALEKGFNVKIGDYVLKGVMDRIDKHEDGIEIIDYKTGRSKSEKEVKKTQLLIYQLAAQQAMHGEVKALTFYYLDDGKRVSFVGSDKQLEKLQKDVVETIEKILSGNFEPTPSKFTCTYCDFNAICDYSQA
ncbi:MAG: ATP-dependent helicase [Patescibacteria group bacterium]